jgi:hypothetical protein
MMPVSARSGEFWDCSAYGRIRLWREQMKTKFKVLAVGQKIEGGTVKGKRGTFLVADENTTVVCAGFKTRLRARAYVKEIVKILFAAGINQ